MYRFHSILFVMITILVSACSKDAPLNTVKKIQKTEKTTKRYRIPYDNAKKMPQTVMREVISPVRKKIQGLLRQIIGSKGTITIAGKTYVADCSGMVRGIYEAIGIDLMQDSHRFPEVKGGVEIIHKSYKANEWKDVTTIPKVGDLIFFNNTWDANKNGKWDDPLTHVGIVEGIEEGSNTISFIHAVHAGIRRYRINLDHPKDYMYKKRKMNDFLRRRPDWDKDRTKYMSSNLFFSYINILK